MKQVLIKTLGIVDILLGISLLLLYISNFPAWIVFNVIFVILPMFIAIILTFVGAFYAIKKNNRRWALAGIIIAVAGFGYFFIISYFSGP